MKVFTTLKALFLVAPLALAAGCAHDSENQAHSVSFAQTDPYVSPLPSRTFNVANGNFERQPPFGARGNSTRDLDW